MIKIMKLLSKKPDNNMGSKKNIGIAVRLTAVAVGMLLLLGVILITFSAINLKQSIKEKEKESLRNTAFTLKNAYYTLYGGDFSKLKDDVEIDNRKAKDKIESNAIDASSVDATVDVVSSATKKEQINAMTIIDTLHDETGVDISIYWGDVRIATSFKDDFGIRLVGAKLGDEVKRQVIDLNDEYFSEKLFIEGHNHYVYYLPIHNGNEVLGVLGVAQNSDVIDGKVSETINGLLLFAIIVTAIFIIILFLILRRISSLIHQASEALHVIADGDLSVEINNKMLNRSDEIGQLGLSMVKLRDEIKSLLGNIKLTIVTLSTLADELDKSTKNTKITIDDVAKAMEDISRGGIVSGGGYTEC